MYEIKIEDQFSAAHRLRNYDGRCEGLHGHNWKVEIMVVSDSLDESGMVLDFKILKELTRKVLQTLDHEYLNDLPNFKKANPSSENIANYIFRRLKTALKAHRVLLERVTVWESSSASASYVEDHRHD